MVTFPSRKIIDIREYNKLKIESDNKVLYHNKDYYKELTLNDIERLNIRFNLYDVQQKIFIARDIEFSELKCRMNNPKLKILRVETIADAKVIPLYDYNNIWKNL